MLCHAMEKRISFLCKYRQRVGMSIQDRGQERIGGYVYKRIEWNRIRVVTL